jgi:hypothetical protein
MKWMKRTRSKGFAIFVFGIWGVAPSNKHAAVDDHPSRTVKHDGTGAPPSEGWLPPPIKWNIHHLWIVL